MKQRIGGSIVLAAMLGSGNVLAATPDIKPGMWETTVVSTVEGMPMAPPPITRQHCITADDLVPHAQAPGENCSMGEPDISGDTVRWEMKCNHEGMETVGSGVVTYTGERYEGDILVDMKGSPMGPMKMTQKISGRRIGDCK